MKFQNSFLLCVVLATGIFLNKKIETTPITTNTNKEFKLVIERGAFHYDRFEIIPKKITYFPQNRSAYDQIKYNSISEVEVDEHITQKLLEDIENKGFWELKNQYSSSSSCLSELKITLYANGKSKSVICDDFQKDCHDLIKFIDQKAIELEGNNLKRIYLPG